MSALALAEDRPLDLAREVDVRYTVDAYAERVGDTFGPYHFDRDRAVAAILYFPRQFRLTKGKWAGQPFTLAPWQAVDIIAPAFGWRCSDGTRRYRRAHVWVPRKNGKALALDTPIPTPQGWSTMGALGVGDEVFDDHGAVCRVTFATPVQYGRSCYRVSFSDGTSICADADHRWLAKPKYGSPRVVTTAEMAQRIHVGNRATHVERNWTIAVAGALRCVHADLPIDPYVLGAWLGDGHQGDARITIAADSPEVKAGIEAAGYTVTMVPSSASHETSPTYWLSQGERRSANSVVERLRNLGLIGDKHIPARYLRASVEQRLGLLRGLVDTDGHVERHGQIEIVTVLDRMRDDILDLVRGLGMKAQCTTDTAWLDDRDMGPRHRIRFFAYDDVPVATVVRKRSAQKPRPAKPTRNAALKVVAIDEIESVPVRCIEVDSPSHLYLAGRGMTPTHNTELLGGVGVMHLVGDGEYGGEVYSIATKEDQAAIVFDVGKAMVRRSPSLSSHIRCFADSMWCDDYQSVWRPLSGIPKGSHGKGPSALLGDEVHEWSDDRLYQFLAQGMGARQQPMEWTISTAGEQSGFGWELWNSCLDLVNGTIDDPRTLVAIYAAGADDDWHDPQVWKKANPNYGISLGHEYMVDQYQKALRLARHENDFKRYHLNMWVGQAERWLKIDLWDKGGQWRLGQPKPWIDRFESFAGRMCFIGVDLASTTDTCAVVLLFPPSGGSPTWDVLCRFYLPDADITERSRHSRVPFEDWAAEGAIELTAGNVADHDRIERDLAEMLDRFEVKGVGFDPWNATAMMIRLNERQSDVAVKVPQTMLGLSGASKMLERLVLDGKLDHAGHPVLRWMASNVAIVRDEKENIMPAKKKSAQKIDGITALCTALAVASGFEAAAPEVEVVSTGYMR